MTDDSTTPARQKVTVVGAGVIGISWTALFLAHGLEVTICDPRPDVREAVSAGLAEMVPGMWALGLETEGLSERIRYEAHLATAVADADVVQENGPERLETKQDLWRTIEMAAPVTALFATSTSGITATRIGAVLDHADRLVVGHPFNPPHLVPLVEIVPGERTSPETVARAVRFYSSLGKRPQVVHKECAGFVANRLQAALFRECVNLVAEGVVTEAEVDDVVTSSIGLRWAVAGPFLTFHLGGGPGGMADFVKHLGPGLEAIWADLGAPKLDAATSERLVEQAEQGFGERSIASLEADRDRGQIAVMRARR